MPGLISTAVQRALAQAKPAHKESLARQRLRQAFFL